MLLERASRKAAARPVHATACCCGLTLAFGTRLVLLVHLVPTVWLIVAAFGHLIMQDPAYSYTRGEGLVLETLMAAFALVGVPVIMGALWGTFSKSPVLVRVYWYYLLVSVALLLCWTIRNFMMKGACDHVPELFKLQYGYAYTCGLLRGFHALAVICLFAVPIYLVLIVLSYCDDLTYGIVGPELSDLSVHKERFWKPFSYRRLEKEQHETREQLAAYGMGGPAHGRPDRGGSYGAVYDEICAQGLGGSTPLFGRTFHDLKYPRKDDA